MPNPLDIRFARLLIARYIRDGEYKVGPLDELANQEGLKPNVRVKQVRPGIWCVWWRQSGGGAMHWVGKLEVPLDSIYDALDLAYSAWLDSLAD